MAISRREMLAGAAGIWAGCVPGVAARALAGAESKACRLGVCIHAFGIRMQADRARGGAAVVADPMYFLDYCGRLGAGGVQVGLGAGDEAYAGRLRHRAEERGMFIEGIVRLPGDRADVERFEAEVRTAKRAGARTIRVVMIPGRRYETYATGVQFREAAERGWQSLRLAEPVAARHRIPLAVENHKDHRVAERLEVLNRLSSEYVGVCVDTGNSIALLEDPMEVVKAYAPWARSAHLKDAAVREYDDGFLLGDVLLGEGFLDLPAMVGILREARPEIDFSLEMVTRDPLKVPCLTDKYWASLADVPARDLARTLKMVRDNASVQPLPRVSDLPPQQRLRREEDNVRKCLEFAREPLKF